MKYALFIVVSPSGDAFAKTNELACFARNLRDIELPADKVETLVPGAYLCNLSYGLQILSMLVAVSAEHHLESRTLFFDQEPAWITSNPKSLIDKCAE